MSHRDAGRALDAEIAEVIFGATWGSSAWTAEGCEWLRFSADQSPRSMVTLAARGDLASGRSLEVWDACPHYSTEIRDAWHVVDKMHARVYEYSCTPDSPPAPWPGCNYLTLSVLDGTGRTAATFCCILDDNEWHEHPEHHGGAMGESPAHAICLAALMAIGSASERTEG